MILIFLLGAIFNRIRGGGLTVFINRMGLAIKEVPFVKTFHDIVYSVTFTIFLSKSPHFHTYQVYIATILFITMDIGRSFGWGGYIGAIISNKIDPERKDVSIIDYFFKKSKNPILGGVIALSARGFIWTLSLYLGFLFINAFVPLSPSFYYIPLIGLMMGPVYWFTCLICQYTSTRSDGWILGEVIFGGYLWSTVYLLLS